MKGIYGMAFWDRDFGKGICLIFLWRKWHLEQTFSVFTFGHTLLYHHTIIVYFTNKIWIINFTNHRLQSQIRSDVGENIQQTILTSTKSGQNVVCCYFLWMWAPPCALETADHLQRQRSHQAIRYPSQVGSTKLCPYIPSIIDPVDECSLSQPKIYWPSKNNLSVPKRNDNFSNWKKGPHVKVKPITNKTENPPKDALDRSKNYAKN